MSDQHILEYIKGNVEEQKEKKFLLLYVLRQRMKSTQPRRYVLTGVFGTGISFPTTARGQLREKEMSKLLIWKVKIEDRCPDKWIKLRKMQ